MKERFIAAKCSQCGADIQVDAQRESGFCSYCGAKYVTEKIVHNYVTNNQIVTNYEQTTNINASTVHIHNDEINRLFMLEEGILVKYKGRLRKVTVPEGVLEIGYGAFTYGEEDDAPGVNEVILPKSLTVIQNGAFNEDSIKSVVAPEDGNLRVIESDAFCGSEVVVFLVPSTVKEIGKNAFGEKTIALFRESEEEVKRKFPNLSDRIICGVEGLGEERGFSYVSMTDGAYIYDCKDYYRKRESDDDVGYPATLGGKKTVGYFGLYNLIPPIERGVEVLPAPAFKNCWFPNDNKIKTLKIPNTVKRIEKGAFNCTSAPSIEFEEGTVLDFWSSECIAGHEERYDQTRAFATAGAINPPKLRKGDFYDEFKEIVLTVDKNLKRDVYLYFSLSDDTNYYADYCSEEISNLTKGVYKDGELKKGYYDGGTFKSSKGFTIVAGHVAPGETKKFYMLPDWRWKYSISYPDEKNISFSNVCANPMRYEIFVQKKLFGTKATIFRSARKPDSDDER